MHMSSMARASSRWLRMVRTLSSRSGLILLGSFFSNSRFKPLCRKPTIVVYCSVHRYTRQQEYNPNRRFLRPPPLLPSGARAATIGAGGSSRLVHLRSLAAQQQQPQWSARAAQIKMIQPILVSIENKWVTKGGWIILIQPSVFRGAAPYRRVDLALAAFGISADGADRGDHGRRHDGGVHHLHHGVRRQIFRHP